MAAPTDEQRARWPLTVPAVAQLLAEGLEMPSGALVLVGENGSGKSTVMELLAVTLGLNPEGGSVNTRHRTRASEPGSMGLVVERSPGASRWGYFLRDETLHGLYSYLEANPSSRSSEPRFHELSHGEAFLQVLGDRARGAGTYLLDEPDAALSFGGSLALVAALLDLVAAGAQVVVASHSPVIAALPGAQLLEVGSWGMRPARWEELELTRSWRQFLAAPASYLRHLS
ncbi:ABC transporter ATP-binding protein [Blastococcus sp. TML/M2B]|uniref:ATP-binding cassette domain-containing protein n=1 Tax=unclassified Blastococcus TaxID=2619396 RepID=UPI00190A3427|nr:MULTISPECIES: ABC transporter ATP-binding protein [unclassified Blastococcus]MBN1092950.1 ABC transporter ATP-binding protein [Blastococcus sp. TML/M2B]MBN1096945.1 ABC transporter ATP-binding protein [Blastococcus sp. TML/C7B]